MTARFTEHTKCCGVAISCNPASLHAAAAWLVSSVTNATTDASKDILVAAALGARNGDQVRMSLAVTQHRGIICVQTKSCT